MPIPPRTPLLTLLQLEQAQAELLRKALLSSARKVEAQLSALGDGGNPITRMQLEAQRASIKGYLAQDFKNVQSLVKDGQVAAAKAASEVTSRYENELLKLALSKESMAQLAKSEALRAANGVEAAMRRMEGSSYIPLSKQVYNTQRLGNKYIDRILNDALITGKTWKQLAKEVADSINPNVKGGVSYAANRLARTEINNAFHASAAKRFEESVIVEGIDWKLSSSHPEGDICDDLAAASPYAKKSIPQKPHPHCYCFLTPALPSEKDFLDNLFAGKYGDGEWAPKVEPVKLDLPKLPTRFKLDQMSTAAVKREYKAADEAFWSFRRNYNGESSAMYRDPMYAALKERYDFWQKAERDRIAAAAAKAKIAAAEKKAAAAASAGSKIAALPRLPKPPAAMSSAYARGIANPMGWKNTRTLSYAEVVKQGDYLINCTRVSATVEMRMRGYDVKAAAAGKDAPGKDVISIEQNWTDKAGRNRHFKVTTSERELMEEMQKAPEGARFLMMGAWKQGGAHIWNAEKKNGEIIYHEGQVNASGSGTGRLTYDYNKQLSFTQGVRGSRSPGVMFMRVDDLTPSDKLVERGWFE
jgi:hypothetical protein